MKKRVHLLFLLAIALCATTWAQRRVEENARTVATKRRGNIWDIRRTGVLAIL